MLRVPADRIADYVDQPLEPSGWLRIDQARIDAFADATLDHQFIHVDREKAAKTPFGSTIAHGYLTMSLISHFLGECGIGPDSAEIAVNYGSDKVRFLLPVVVDSDIRGRATLMSVSDKAPGQLLLKTGITIDIRGQDKPALIAEILTLFFLR
ncbi:MAG: MaoC family dehydratase [Woeseiaceae bacterium]